MTKKLGKKLKFLRERCNLSRKELGDLVGINQSQVWEFENRYFKNPSAPIIASMARILNTSTEFLVDDKQLFQETSDNSIEETKNVYFLENMKI